MYEKRQRIQRLLNLKKIIDKNISHKPIDYEKLNRLSEDFGKRFTPQQEMDAEQAFWLRISNPTSKPSDASTVKINPPKELPKVSLVNDSLKKLKFYLARFDNVVKIRTTPDARTKKFFAYNDLKAQVQDKDSTICMLKDMIKSMREKSKDKNVKYDYYEIETKNVELEKSVAKLLSENEHLYKVFVITSLKNDLRKIKGKEIVDIAAQIPSVNTIIPGMFKLDLEPLAPRLLQNREAHIDYLKYTQEQADILQEIVEQAKVEHPLDKELDFAYSNTPVLTSTGFKCSTSKCGSNLTGNKRNDRISQITSWNMKNKVEAQPRKVNKKNCVVKTVHDVNVKHSLLPANFEPVCATCKKSLFDGVHDICFLDFMKNVNSRAKSAKKHKKENILRPTGHVFTELGLKTTSANVVPPKTTTSHSVESQKPELKFYSRKLKNVKNTASSKKAKIVESKNANHSEPNHTWGSNATDIPLSSSSVMTVRFENDHIARSMGYGDYQLGNVTISSVYYVEVLGHNLFFVGQFCDGDLEVAFRKNTCFIRNLEGGDLLFGSHDTNLYTISLDNILKTSLICLLSKASKTKSWLWHRQLSHLNFGTINKLAKDGLVRGIPRLKFQKDHLCSACALGKSKKSSHQPKVEDTN
ncbi:retrovirus-related pol polyprotein from transposon TNT 1-94 [Tanacetum coccineum]|uniref:Retrovirus-related pol polyprotein from transposon TNT 1-94 n=1 Tax=Tanacetum coccineum TaxID=301880 RepID=A0ABQ5J776_9ASTR